MIGEGLVTALVDHAYIIAERVGAPLRLTVVADKDPGRLEVVRAMEPSVALLDDAFEVVKRDDVDVVVELIGGVEVADRLVRAALEAKKHVVTANKALLAERGEALFALAEANGCDLYFEAAVAGAIPVIRVIRESLASDHIESVRGIINGTSNYILTSMANEGAAFADALRAAQKAGFAEADPTLDITGGDAGHKLAILAGLAFGARVSPKEIPTEGIDEVDPRDIRYARKFGYAIRPLAVAGGSAAAFSICAFIRLWFRRVTRLRTSKVRSTPSRFRAKWSGRASSPDPVRAQGQQQPALPVT